MILRYPFLAGFALLSAPLSLALSASDIPADTPISSLVTSANSLLAAGNFNDALLYFDVAIQRDPLNYLTIFKRGATYLSLGRTPQATEDFNKVLTIRPDFEGALLQRAKIHSKHADWDLARKDYAAAGKKGGQEIAELDEAAGAAILASDAAKHNDWEGCVTNAGVAIMVASSALELRELRARCRFEKGEIREAVNDLAHILQIAPGKTEPHLQISAMLFYSLGDIDRGLAQIRKCLHSDPDSKACSKMFRREKVINKELEKVNGLWAKRQFNSAVKLLVNTGSDEGLIEHVKNDVKELRDAGTIHKNAPDDLVLQLLEMACEGYTEMNSIKKSTPYCTSALNLNPHSLHGLLARAQELLDREDFDAAISVLNTANDAHPSHQKVQSLLQKAQQLLKRSKQKDYYKVLGLSHDADERDIKLAYRRMTKTHHPDKAMKTGISKEDAEKKMAAINEAYEVLSDPELKRRFDMGDDPNSHEQQGQPFQGSPFGQGQQFVYRQGGSGGGAHFKFQGGFPGGGFPFGGF